MGGTRTVLAHLTIGRFVSNYENENGSRHRRERRAYLAHAHAVLARRFKPASQAIKPASQRPPLCTETAELRNQFQNLVIRGPFSRLLLMLIAKSCQWPSQIAKSCQWPSQNFRKLGVKREPFSHARIVARFVSSADFVPIFLRPAVGHRRADGHFPYHFRFCLARGPSGCIPRVRSRAATRRKGGLWLYYLGGGYFWDCWELVRGVGFWRIWTTIVSL